MTLTGWLCTTFYNFPTPVSRALSEGTDSQFQPLQVSTKYSSGLPGSCLPLASWGRQKPMLFRGGGDPSSTLTWRPQVLVTRSGSPGRGCEVAIGSTPHRFCLDFPNNGPSNRGLKGSGLAVFSVSSRPDGSARFYLPSQVSHGLLREEVLRPQPHTWMHFS